MWTRAIGIDRRPLDADAVIIMSDGAGVTTAIVTVTIGTAAISVPTGNRAFLVGRNRGEVAGAGIGRPLIDVIVLDNRIGQPFISPPAATGVAARIIIDRRRRDIHRSRRADIIRGNRPQAAAGATLQPLRPLPQPLLKSSDALRSPVNFSPILIWLRLRRESFFYWSDAGRFALQNFGNATADQSNRINPCDQARFLVFSTPAAFLRSVLSLVCQPAPVLR